MESIRISIIQTDIVWENKQENLRLLHEKLQSLRGITEIVVLPEMFSFEILEIKFDFSHVLINIS